jgi:hypothetical protein
LKIVLNGGILICGRDNPLKNQTQQRHSTVKLTLLSASITIFTGKLYFGGLCGPVLPGLCSVVHSLSPRISRFFFAVTSEVKSIFSIA